MEAVARARVPAKPLVYLFSGCVRRLRIRRFIGSPDMSEALKKEDQEAEATTDDSVPRLHGRYAIDPATPMPEHNSPSAPAYYVRDNNGEEGSLFGLICTPGLPIRSEILAALKGEAFKGLMPVRDWGVVDWPPLGQRCMAVIYETPVGRRLAQTPDTVDVKINEYDIPRVVVEPLLGGLQEMVARTLFHRAIRPHNMFFEDEKQSEVTLGDAATAPPGYDQPVIFEPISQAMADPAGRGDGTSVDDMYALGVSLVFLLLGENPVAHMSDDELISAKIEHGSYTTLCGRAQIPVPMIEPLRGLLSDDPAERWRLEQLEIWVSGRQASPMQKKSAPRAESSFKFQEEMHLTVRTLAKSLASNINEAAKTIKDGELALWLRRSLRDADLSEDVIRLSEAAKSLESTPMGSNEVLVSQVSMRLDPDGPVRYKGCAFMPEGIGAALAVALLRDGNAQIHAEAISRDLPILWLKNQGEYNPDSTAMEKTFGQLRGFLKIQEPGYGIERCLYELNPAIPCQSPIVLKEHIVDLRNLIPVLDQMAAESIPEEVPMDRHLAAFIAAHFDQDVSPHLRVFGSTDEAESIVGVLSLLAFMHWRLRLNPAPNLAAWIGSLLGPAVATFHSRTIRQEIKRQIPQVSREGNLTDLFDLIDNTKKRQQDRDAYSNSVAQFTEAEKELRQIEESNARKSKSAERVGQRIASLLSIFMALIVTSVLFFMDLW